MFALATAMGMPYTIQLSLSCDQMVLPLLFAASNLSRPTQTPPLTPSYAPNTYTPPKSKATAGVRLRGGLTEHGPASELEEKCSIAPGSYPSAPRASTQALSSYLSGKESSSPHFHNATNDQRSPTPPKSQIQI